MKTAYLGLGSNLGNRLSLLLSALRRLPGPGLELRRVSSVYETTPVGVLGQPDFLNLVAEVGTALSPRELLARCLEIEAALGRVRHERWGPRTVDIDLLWMEGERIEVPDLILPHPRMLERGFVLVPLAELVPDLVLDGETAGRRATAYHDGEVRKVGLLNPNAPPT